MNWRCKTGFTESLRAYLIISLCFPSSLHFACSCARAFPTVYQVHSRHLIHRDIKPANFVMGTDTSELCYCIDFGLSKRFRNPHTLAHIPHRVGKSLTGENPAT